MYVYTRTIMIILQIHIQRLRTSSCFYLFLGSTGHHKLDDKAAYHLPRIRHWLFDLVQLLAHQELFAPTFNFVIQHLLSRILL